MPAVSVFVFALLLLVGKSLAADPSTFNVEWLDVTPEPGTNRAGQSTVQGGMPVGNGDVALLVFPQVEAGAVSVWVSKQDALASDTALFKLGQLQLTVRPNPFSLGSYFNQSLDLATATVFVEAGGSNHSDYAWSFSVWVNALSNQVHMSATPGPGLSAADALSSETELRLIALHPTDGGFNYTSKFDCSGPAFSPPDVIPDSLPVPLSGDKLLIYHRNRGVGEGRETEFFGNTMRQQGLASIIEDVPNFVANRTFGMVVTAGPGFSRKNSTLLSGSGSAEFVASILCEQTDTLEEWLEHVKTLLPDQAQPSTARATHEEWWSEFWNRSWVEIASQPLLSQQYAITRFVQAIQSRVAFGKEGYPIKFNGMLFVANRPGNRSSYAEGQGPDYRDWGANNWWQNTRLPYWSMLPAGDTDTMLVLFEYYLRMLPFTSRRTEIYFNHTGVFFTETKTVYGLYAQVDYGCDRDASWPLALENNPYLKLDFGGDAGGTEIVMMIFEYFLYTGDETFLRRYMPVVDAVLDFFSKHYPARDAQGKMEIFPTQSLETYWCGAVTSSGWIEPTLDNCPLNDHPTTAALYALTEKALALPEHVTTADQRAQWRYLRDMLPPLPLIEEDGLLTTSPMANYPKDATLHNSETPELYSVHPFRLYTLARNITTGVNLEAPVNCATLSNRTTCKNFNCNDGWCQGVLNAALLGLTDIAANMVTLRAAIPPAAGYRFQGFAPHEQDYEPSADHYANMNSGVNWMLLQPADDGFDKGTMVLFPAWPCNWSVSFKLNGPLNTTVEGVYESASNSSGTLTSFTVTPASRKSAVLFARCITNPAF